MKAPTSEVLLALRAPNAGWLAALVCAIDEAQRDSGFSSAQRDLLHRLLDSESLPASVVGAAHERLARFEESLLAAHAELDAAEAACPPPAAPARPKLTLCVANA